MRTIAISVSAALTSASLFTGAALADDRLHLTPPLYREQARATQQTRPASELVTLPNLVPTAAPVGVKVSAAGTVRIEAAAR